MKDKQWSIKHTHITKDRVNSGAPAALVGPPSYTNGILSLITYWLFTYMFSLLYHCQHPYRELVFIWAIWWVSYKKQELLTFVSTWVDPGFLVGTVMLIFLLYCPIMCLYVLSSMLGYRCSLRFQQKPMFGLSLLPFVCRKDRVLFTLFAFVCA